MNRISTILPVVLFVLCGVHAAAGPTPTREIILGRGDAVALPGTLLEPVGSSRWHFDSLDPVTRGSRVWSMDESHVVVEDRAGASVRSTVYSDPRGGDAALLWQLPDRDRSALRPGYRQVLEVVRASGDDARRLRILVETVGIGWVHLPSGPREAALQEALVLSAPEGSRRFEVDRLVHRWVDPRAGVVAEISGPATPDGRGRLAVDTVSWAESVVAGAADLVIYADQIIKGAYQRVSYTWDLGGGVPVSSLTPEGYSTIGDLIAASAWDFSSNTGGIDRAATSAPVNSAETCNWDQCGYSEPGVKLDREDRSFDDPTNLIKNNQVTERFDDPVDGVTVYLRAGAQREGKQGIFGDGESRFCYVSDASETRSEVTLWRFAHEDAQGEFFLQPGDSWTSPEFQCEQNIFNTVCGEPGFFDELWSQACGTHSGTQSGEVLKGGVVTLPSGHTVNAMLLRTVADFCVYSVDGCSFLFKVDEVRTVVYLWSAPNLGTVALIQSEQNAPDLTSWSISDETSFGYGLFPPITIQAGTTTDSTVDLSWNPGNDTRRIVGYKVYWDTDSGGSSPYAFNSEDHPSQATIVGTTATISGLDSGTTYYFTVTSLSDFTDPSSGIVTRYESILYPTQVSGDPDLVYPVEVAAQTTGGGCTPAEEVVGVVANKVGSDLELCWSPVFDPCADGYDVLGADSPASAASFTTVGGTVGLETCWTGQPSETYFLVVARGSGGTGPWGHFGQ